MVPAVVVFSVLAGVALMGMPNKATLLQPVAVFNEAMGRVGALVTKTTPFGIFAIAAHTAGTMRLEEFERLQAFLIVYAGFACFLTFWLLPGLVAATTHVRHRRLVGAAQSALLTAFVTSNYFVVLPLLTEQARELLAEAGERDKTEDELVEVLVPTSFNFPHAAKVLSVAFVPFVAWYSGMPLDPRQYPALAGAGLLSVFGSINSAIPFLLDLVQIPVDHFRLFVVSGVLNSRFGSMTAAMHTLVIAILGTCLITGRVRLQKARLVRFAVASLAIVAVFLAGTRLLLARVLPEPATRAEVLAAIKPRPPLAPATLLRELPPPPEPRPAPGKRLEEIVRSGRLRVGFDGDSVPWAFLNARRRGGGLRRGDGAPARPRPRRAARARGRPARALRGGARQRHRGRRDVRHARDGPAHGRRGLLPALRRGGDRLPRRGPPPRGVLGLRRACPDSRCASPSWACPSGWRR